MESEPPLRRRRRCGGGSQSVVAVALRRRGIRRESSDTDRYGDGRLSSDLAFIRLGCRGHARAATVVKSAGRQPSDSGLALDAARAGVQPGGF